MSKRPGYNKEYYWLHKTELLARKALKRLEKKRERLPRVADLTGKIFGRLTVLARSSNKAGQAMWLCSCSCGKELSIRGQCLRNGGQKSCGCIERENLFNRNYRHGAAKTKKQSPTREYNVWIGAKARCFNPRDKKFKDYGGRGISMCAEWRNDFAAFLRDMGKAPAGNGLGGFLTLDRYPNNDGNYEPGNCRWATSLEQVHNRRPLRRSGKPPSEEARQ